MIKENLANRKNYGGARSASQIKYIVIHYTGNDGDHDEGNATYFKNNVVSASAHFFVDDDSITMSVPELFTAWSVGGTKWKDCTTTGGGTMYGKITNANSISVEMCDTKKDGKFQASEKTLANTAELVKSLMKKYNISIENVYRHFDVTGKHCPSYFMYAPAWEAFKERLKESDTVPIYKTLDDIPSWAKETVKKLIAHGSLKGDANGELNLDRNMLRLLVINDREGLYGK
jgi:N-acetylmuramoyl-L-alanine amidase CwlA